MIGDSYTHPRAAVLEIACLKERALHLVEMLSRFRQPLRICCCREASCRAPRASLHLPDVGCFLVGFLHMMCARTKRRAAIVVGFVQLYTRQQGN